jgi:hypothetical protein
VISRNIRRADEHALVTKMDVSTEDEVEEEDEVRFSIP